MKRKIINLISIVVMSCYIVGCAVKVPGTTTITAAPETTTTTSETTEATTTTEARGHFEFKPVVISTIFRDIMGEDMYKAYCNYVKAVQNGEDSFEVKDEHTYDWMIGQFPCQLQPLYFVYTESNYGGAYKDGSATFQYKIPKEELAAKEPSVIISRRPCALLKYVKHNPPIKCNEDKCKSCKSCMKLGCPAISMKNNKAHIDETLCVGCNVCKQLCPFDAL